MSKLDMLISDINKNAKENIGFIGEDSSLIKYQTIPFSSPKVNYMMYGGLPMGRMIEFAGAEKSGKTTTTLDVIKNCQIEFKKEYDEAIKKAKKEKKDISNIIERKAVFVDLENTFDVEWAKKIGVDMSKLYIIVPQGQYAEEILTIMIEMVQSGEVGFIALDSIANLVSKVVQENTLEQKTYAGNAALLAIFCNKIVPELKKHNCMLILINQVREDLNNPYVQYKTPGGMALKHNCTVRLMFRQGDLFDSKGNKVPKNFANPAGHNVMIHIEKSKVCKSDRKLSYYTLNYNNGIDFIGDSIDVLIELGIIRQAGSWFSIINDETGEELFKAQGKPAIQKELQENKQLFLQLQEKILYN